MSPRLVLSASGTSASQREMRSWSKRVNKPATTSLWAETHERRVGLVEGNHVAIFRHGKGKQHNEQGSESGVPSGVDLDISDVACSETITTGTAHPAR